LQTCIYLLAKKRGGDITGARIKKKKKGKGYLSSCRHVSNVVGKRGSKKIFVKDMSALARRDG